MNSKIGKKNLEQFLKEELGDSYNDVFKKQLQKLKKGATLNKQTKQIMVKNCSLFDIPHLLWAVSSFDHFYFMEENSKQAQLRQKISFTEFSKNRGNFEFLKEFNRLNDYQPHVFIQNSNTGDIIQVNKGFIYSLFDQDDEE